MFGSYYDSKRLLNPMPYVEPEISCEVVIQPNDRKKKFEQACNTSCGLSNVSNIFESLPSRSQ